MEWLKLSSAQMASAIRECGGVALIPIGSMESHGPHLPCGNDTLTAERIAALAAEREPVLVLPSMAYTWEPQGRRNPGAVCLQAKVLIDHLENVCDDVARNGCRKIVLLQAHGGNVPMEAMFLGHVAERRKQYAVYSIPPWAGLEPLIRELKESAWYGHACEVETSISLCLYPELVHLEALGGRVYEPGPETPWWPAVTPLEYVVRNPEMCKGDPGKASAEKGRRLVDAWVENVVKVLRAVKEDALLPELMRQL